MHPNRKEIEWCEEVARLVVSPSCSQSMPTEPLRSKIQDIKKANAFLPFQTKTAKQGYYKRVEDDATLVHRKAANLI